MRLCTAFLPRPPLPQPPRRRASLAKILALALGAAVLGGCSPWLQAEASCVRYPTPDARAECSQRQREWGRAYEAEQRAKDEARKAAEAQAFQRIAMPPAPSAPNPAPAGSPAASPATARP